MLADFQKQMKQALLYKKATTDIFNQLTPSKIQPEDRLSIYQNNVNVSLVSCLSAAFPVIEKIVGEEFFYQGASLYIREHPPEEPCLAKYGNFFPSWLERQPQTQNLPYLGDVGRLEWARLQSWFAPKSKAFSPELLLELSPEQLLQARASFKIDIQLIDLKWPALDIWLFNQNPEDDFTAKMTPTPHQILLHRSENAIIMKQPSPDYACFLKMVLQNHTFEEIATFLEKNFEETTFGTCLSTALQDQLFQEIKTNKNEERL